MIERPSKTSSSFLASGQLPWSNWRLGALLKVRHKITADEEERTVYCPHQNTYVYGSERGNQRTLIAFHSSM